MEMLTGSWTFVSFVIANIATFLLSIIFLIKEPKPTDKVGEDYVD